MKDITLHSNSLCSQLIRKTNLDTFYRTYDTNVRLLRLTPYKRRPHVFLVKKYHYSNMQDMKMVEIGLRDGTGSNSRIWLRLVPRRKLLRDITGCKAINVMF